jgi:DNA-directed RNA polymerase alpha subunit
MTLTFSTIKREVVENHYQKEIFLIEALDSGQSITLANAIRRTMLSELYGFAITGVRINDLKHEFDTIPSIREDTLEVLLNLKEIVFKPSFFLYYSELEKLTLFLHVKGPCVVTASMLRLPLGMLDIVNPNQYICTIIDNSEFYCEIDLSYGKGFKLKEEYGERNETIKEVQLQESVTREVEDFLLSTMEEENSSQNPLLSSSKEKLFLETKQQLSINKGLGAILKERIFNLYSFLAHVKEETFEQENQKSKKLLRNFQQTLKKEKFPNQKRGLQKKEKVFQRLQKLYQKKAETSFHDLSEKVEKVIGEFLPPLGAPSTLHLDANFIPVKNVNFKVRLISDSLGNLHESLQLEITTNGSFTPRRCLQESLKFLLGLFSSLLRVGDVDQLIEEFLEEFENENLSQPSFSSFSLKKGNLSFPSYWPTSSFPFLWENSFSNEHQLQDRKKDSFTQREKVQLYSELTNQKLRKLCLDFGNQLDYYLGMSEEETKVSISAEKKASGT